MASPQPTPTTTPSAHLHVSPERCPWCDQPIPHEKFEEITGRIQAREREHFAAMERHLKEAHEADVADRERKAAAKIAQVKKEAERTIEQNEREAAAREARIRKEVKEAAAVSAASRVARAEAERDQAQQQLASAKEEFKQGYEQRLQAELAKQRKAMEKDKVDAVHQEQAKEFQRRQKLEKQVDSLQRQLQNKTAEELGEGAEIDLFEALREAFPDDRIKRIPKGAPGADILHDVIHEGEHCGRIIYDAKNHRAWRNSFVTKLREDQLAAHAEHAVLATRAFPAGKTQLHTQDGVLVANPARVVVLVEMIRIHLVQTHRLRLSQHELEEKSKALYDFINSERCAQLFAQFETLAENLLELDVKEKAFHDKTWKQRGHLVRDAQKVILGQLRDEIGRLIRGTNE